MKWKRNALAAITLVILAPISCSDAPKPNEPIHIVSWGGQFQADLMQTWVEPAAKEAGVPIRTEIWAGDYGALSLRIKSGLNAWDLVHVEAHYVMDPRRSELFHVLDIDLNSTSVDRSFLDNPQTATVLKENMVIPVLQYAYVAFARGEETQQAPNKFTWSDFWNIKQYPGRRGLRNTPIGNIEAALLSMGRNPDSELYNLRDPAAVDDITNQALERLNEIAGEVLWWSSGDTLESAMTTREVVYGAAWSGRAFRVHEKLCGDKTPTDCDLLRVYPDTALISTDWWIVPKNSIRKSEVEKLAAKLYGTNGASYARLFFERQGYSSPIKISQPIDSTGERTLQYFFDLGRGDLGGQTISESFWGLHHEKIQKKWELWRNQASG